MTDVVCIPETPINPNHLPLRIAWRKTTNGWVYIKKQKQFKYLNRAEKIVYLGWCQQDGDMFALYTFDGYIMIFKGELNSGTY